MPITSIFIIAGIILMFIVFATALAWGEYQTRHIGRSARPHSGTGAQVRSLKKIAEVSDRQDHAQDEAVHPG
jgi:hypothetical protein